MSNCRDYIELWVEKLAMLGILGPVADEWNVPLMISQGFASKGFLHETAESIAFNWRERGRRTFIYHVGDSDPHGWEIWYSMQTTLNRYTAWLLGASEVPVIYQRLAVTEEQIKRYQLPIRPTKPTALAKKYGSPSVEIDAMDKSVITGLVRDALLRHIPERELALLRAVEESERSYPEMIRALKRLSRSEKE